jgi:hypothetical protein
MAMYMSVLSDERLNSNAEWQKAIDAEEFSLRLFDGKHADADNGNLSVWLDDEETSIEYGVYDFSELREDFEHINFGRDWKYAISFTWSSSFAEEIAAWMAATAYARVTGGVVFDQQEGKLFTPDEALAMTREIERRRPELEAILRSFVEQRIAESPASEEALLAFMQRRLRK